MKNLSMKSFVCAAAFVILLSSLPGWVQASSISMPAGSRSWILVGSSDCDDDGPNANVDRGHCVGAVSELNQPGDIGHGQLSNFEVFAGAAIGPDAMHGSIQTTSAQFATIHMSMVDTYTLNSTVLPVGTVVPITVSFHAVGTMYPVATCCGAYGSGSFDIKIGTFFSPDGIVVPEGSRVGGSLGPNSSAQLPFVYPRFSGADVPVDLTATGTLDVAVGAPFDLAYQLGAGAIKSTIDFSNTATISFILPPGTSLTSTGGYADPVPVEAATWGGLKARYR
jgi:hypothetical protein